LRLIIIVIYIVVIKTQGQQQLMGWSTIPDSGEVLTHHSYMCGKTGTTRAQSKMGMVSYLGGLHTLRVDTIIILSYVINITSKIHINNAT